ncbi:hypothetical protein [Clostridium sp. BNL1100]|uniref:P-loop ATPase, Sll1717 family n=1 Tax=Clostridium sp. BNL1100 TaxID=755731 RepID=UPI00024A7F21|nr:hypothetical protein [Clostridium sp. BNL1100]AEY65434.1 hypothetical protein Clo1100_1182 [Clostridium sp. BNL1100]
MTTIPELLELLDFGQVDSESESNLDRKFLKTTDFEKFIKTNIVLIKGVKGSGKSALFEMFSKYEAQTRKLAGNYIDNVIFVTGTGFKDLKELKTDDMEKLMRQPNFDFDNTWQLYIAIKVAIKLGELGYSSGENLSEFLKQAGYLVDVRVLPLIKSLWKLIFGVPPKGIDIEYKGVKFKIGGKTQIDTQDILAEINDLLIQENKEVWVLFDKIDELFSNDYNKRKQCIESLFRVNSQFSQYSKIKLKIFLRNDIWNTLHFVNKDHVEGKTIELTWDNKSLMALLLKRVCSQADILEFISNKSGISQNDILNSVNLGKAFCTLFQEQVYKGKGEANIVDWMIARITDGLGGKYPRDLINFGNISKEIQIKDYQPDNNYLISGLAVRDAYYKVSEIKFSTYLSEFPSLQKHFDRFKGCTISKFDRSDLIKMMSGLDPSDDDMIQQLYEIGIIQPLPLKIKSTSAKKFEIPRLFRSGLGLVLRGRP